MQQQYYAHSKENTDKSNWQPLEEHLKATAQLARQFAQSFNSGDWAELLALYHDLGKYKAEFQNGVLNQAPDKKKRVDHSSAGALALLERFGKMNGRLLAQIVIAHHGGLRDPDSLEGRENQKEKLELAPSLLASVEQRLPELLQTVPQNPSFIMPKALWEKNNLCCFWMRFLFSALVDADFLDTEAFLDERRSQERKKTQTKSMQQLSAILQKHLQQLEDEQSVKKTELNAYRQQLQQRCFESAQLKPGFYQLTAPTGSGKTLAALSFALEHAAKYELNRVIISLPFTAIIEQTAAVLRSIFGEDQVLEHHSNVNFFEDEEKEQQSSLRRWRLASENWEAAIIVTTNVQLFESLYAASVSQCRKLHRIAKSVIILDEPQALPEKYFTPLLSAMKTLQENFAVSWLFSSATPPAWERLPSYVPQIEVNSLQLPATPAMLTERVKWYYPKDFSQRSSWSDLAQNLVQHSQVLCIVNKRNDTLALFKELEQLGKEAYIISTYLCAAHRQKLLQQVNEQLAQGKEICLISTQVIEAGVDIDFPVVYRALAGLDSLMQAAGRCNREGRHKEQGEFHLFYPESLPPCGKLRHAEAVSYELLTAENSQKTTRDALLTKYLPQLYQSIEETMQHDLAKKLKNSALDFEFRTFAKNFQLIEDEQHSFYVHYGAATELLKKLEEKGAERQLIRQLQRFQVRVPYTYFRTWQETGLIVAIDENIYQECRAGAIYDEKYGLQPDKEFLNVEQLVT